RVRAQPVSALAAGDADDGRPQVRRHDHDGVAEPAAHRREERVRDEDAHLADRVRLPDEPARSHARRVVREAGEVHVGGCAARLRSTAGRHPHPLPGRRRARRRPLAERRVHGYRLAEVSRAGTRTTLWGQVRPGGAETYKLLRYADGRWNAVGGTVRTTARG